MINIFKKIKHFLIDSWYVDRNIYKQLIRDEIEINKQTTERIEILMAAIDNLQIALNRLTAATDAAVTVLNTPHPSETAIQAAADLVDAQAIRLETAAGVVTATVVPTDASI